MEGCIMPRERKPGGQAGHGVGKVGGGIGGGPAGPGSYSGRPGTGSSGGRSGEKGLGGSSGSGGGFLLAAILAFILGKKTGGSGSGKGGGSGLGKIIRLAVIVVIVLFVLKSCGFVGGSSYSYEDYEYEEPVYTQTPVSTQESAYGNPYGITTINSGTISNGWTYGSSTSSSEVTATAAPTAAPTATAAPSGSSAGSTRAKYYQPQENETVTIMVYMIATDLESNYGMATSDLQEMLSGIKSIPDNVNLIVYGGGCKNWQNNMFSNSQNLCYKLGNNSMNLLYEDGDKVMTDPDTLGQFIRYCRKNYQANRNILILWDHGGGSVTGYGYDERHKNSGSMDLDGIAEALETGGVKFDWIGFDACLMATAETALTLDDWADYMIASEESEPGIGWYYTNWLSMICSNPSVDTLELGKKIVDDFVDVCNQKCRGQDTTLSVTDLAELSSTLPKALSAFAEDTLSLINNSDYKTVATARSGAKEFASSSKIDQVDLSHLAYNMNTEAGKELTQVISSAVKYNRTSSTVQNAYGLSIYFPLRSLSTVDTAVKTYSEIGITDSYTRCIQGFAAAAASGQAMSGGYSSPYSILSGLSGYSSSSSSYSSYGSVGSEVMYSILQSMLSGRDLGNVKGLTEKNSSFLSGALQGNAFYKAAVDPKALAQTLADNQFDPNLLVWTRNSEGQYTISLPEDQWSLITELKQNLFYDDGEGYIDLGLDLTTDCFTKSGELVGEYSGYWLGLGDWTCAYYLESEVTDEEGNLTISGRIPVLFNEQRGYLKVQWVNNGDAEILGFMPNYSDEDSSVSSKLISAEDFKAEDSIVLIADYYDYSGNYQDTYKISDVILWGEGLTVCDLELQDPEYGSACYMITDIYNQTFWTPVLS